MLGTLAIVHGRHGLKRSNSKAPCLGARSFDVFGAGPCLRSVLSVSIATRLGHSVVKGVATSPYGFGKRPLSNDSIVDFTLGHVDVNGLAISKWPTPGMTVNRTESPACVAARA